MVLRTGMDDWRCASGDTGEQCVKTSLKMLMQKLPVETWDFLVKVSSFITVEC